MSSQFSLNQFRQPEYTGENRCIPCTSVNIAIALTIGGGVGYLWLPAGIGVFVVSLIVIYLRGYLVPGTPAFTKQYLPEPVLRLFNKADVGAEVSPQGSPIGSTMRHGQSRAEKQLDGPETLLLETNTIEPCENRDDFCLSDEFRTTWHQRMDVIDSNKSWEPKTTDSQDSSEEAKNREESVGTNEEAALRRIVKAGNGIYIDNENPQDDVIAYTDSEQVGRWVSRAAFIADISAATELSERYDDWGELMVEERSQVVSGLRIFLEECPLCGDVVEMGEGMVESCCRSREIVAVSCTDCEARLLEIDGPEIP